MLNKSSTALIAVGLLLSAGSVKAADEILVDNDKNVNMAISIYNNNLGFVRDTRKVSLTAGENAIAFEGVASQIKAETAMLSGSGINVIEQNYDYDLLTPNNILEQYVGKTVKTALFNPDKGETIFDKAKVLNSNYGTPILQFNYGVETNFPGRVVYEKVPENLRVKPTLVVNLKNDAAGDKNLELAYLTNGISWKADYIAEVENDDEMSLNTWITLNNETGADYDNASVQLISGSVNQAAMSGGAPRPVMMMAKAARGYAMDNAVMESASVERTNISDYYLYTLPVKTTIKDKQSKQVSLMNMDKVKFTKEYVMTSPLYVGLGARKNEFTKLNPNVVFKLVNDKASNLGVPMPGGVVRFYENDDKKNLQFIGESQIEQSAVGEKIDLTIGKAFDIFAKGSIKAVRAISKDMNEADVEITFNNASEKNKKVVFEQNISDNWEILAENAPREQKNASTVKWTLDIPAGDKTILTYTVRVSRK